jgi:hypothetical protein
VPAPRSGGCALPEVEPEAVPLWPVAASFVPVAGGWSLSALQADETAAVAATAARNVRRDVAMNGHLPRAPSGTERLAVLDQPAGAGCTNDDLPPPLSAA